MSEFEIRLPNGENEQNWAKVINEVFAEKKIDAQVQVVTPLDDLKELWRRNEQRHRHNPMMREIMAVILKHDPKWDCARTFPKPTMTIVMPGAKTPTKA
jgi:hypothetical protein